MSVHKIEFATWPEAREHINELLAENPPYVQTDRYSYKDGSGDATLTSEADWAVVHIGWGATPVGQAVKG